MSDPRVVLLKALADPIRLRVVDRLGHLGPAPFSALAAELDLPLPQLSNHLRRLRAAGLVTVRRDGRHAIYALAADADVVLPVLDRLVRPGRTPAAAREPGRAADRTCYDHLAGPLGVALHRGLVDRGALRAHRDGTVTIADPGPLRALGVEPDAVDPGRRRLAFECLDATEHAPHLAGALGGAVATALLERGWVTRGDGRAVRLAPAGARGLRAAGIDPPR